MDTFTYVAFATSTGSVRVCKGYNQCQTDRRHASAERLCKAVLHRIEIYEIEGFGEKILDTNEFHAYIQRNLTNVEHFAIKLYVSLVIVTNMNADHQIITQHISQQQHYQRFPYHCQDESGCIPVVRNNAGQ